jgi:hypothetical protein
MPTPEQGKNGKPVSVNCGTQDSKPPVVTTLPAEAPSFDWSPGWVGPSDESLHAAYRLVARHVYPALRLGDFGYAAFDHINTTFFEGKLPETLILWDQIEWGHCLGWTRSARDGPPIIKLHPATISPAVHGTGLWRRKYVWGYPIEWLGFAFAYDVLLHEAMHVSVEYLLGGQDPNGEARSYWTSHNNPTWVGELNRIAPCLGYRGDPYTMRTPKRVPAGGVGKSGKPLTRTIRAQDGDAPELEHFPHNLPCRELFYRGRQLPFPWT